MVTRSARPVLVALLLTFPFQALPHVIPDDVTVQAFAKPAGDRLHLLVRVPFSALADLIFPTRPDGDLDLQPTQAMLPDAAKTWISDWIDLYEGDRMLPKPRIVETRISLASDNSFLSYGEALEARHWSAASRERAGLPQPGHARRPAGLSDSIRAVQLRHPLAACTPGWARGDHASIHPGERGSFEPTAIWAIPAFSGSIQDGAKPCADSSPSASSRSGKAAIICLFLFCVALLFRRWRALVPFVIAFSVAHSLTLIAAAYNLAPDALWFPVFFETLIALSIVYLAIESIVEGTAAQNRWMLAAGFGLVYGFGFSFALRQTLQFGGAHVLASILSFNLGIELAQAVALLLFVPLLTLFFSLRIPERIGTIFLAALAAHTGWHRMLDRAKWLRSAQFQWPVVDPSRLSTTLRWMLVISILAGTVYAVFRLLRPLPKPAR